MSGECEKCGEHALECTCGAFSRRQENSPGIRYSHMNPITIPLGDFFIDPPPQKLHDPEWINVEGREEHEAIIKDKSKCAELGLDQVYETIVYLKRWGSFL